MPAPADYLPPLNAYDAALNAITANNRVILFLDKEQQRAETEYLQNEQVLQLEDYEEEQYQAAIAASLAVAHTTHLTRARTRGSSSRTRAEHACCILNGVVASTSSRMQSVLRSDPRMS